MAVHVKLLVTGTLEERGLSGALDRVFQGNPVRFTVAPRLNGFTSERLGEYPRGQPRATVRKLAAELVASVEPGSPHGRGQARPDLVVLIEDLELANRDQPARVLEHLRLAVEEHIEQMSWASPKRDAVFERLRTRASFHLLVPMVEAYFFADPRAVEALAPRVPSQFPAKRDVESFRVRHATEAGELVFQHPKRYCRFLCGEDPREEGRKKRPRSRYRETRQGLRALKALGWEVVLGRVEHCRYARSLLEDLAWGVADRLGGDPLVFPGATAPLTRLEDGGLLRNVSRA